MSKKIDDWVMNELIPIGEPSMKECISDGWKQATFIQRCVLYFWCWFRPWKSGHWGYQMYMGMHHRYAYRDAYKISKKEHSKLHG